MSLQDEIEARYRRELDGCRQLWELAGTLWERNASRVTLDTGRPSTAAVLGLHAKARKTFRAIGLLARQGYGEDRIILARSLINLCIDLGYICREDSDDRARQWMARGRISRRELGERFGVKPPDEAKVDWAVMTTQAKKWKAVPIFDRAKDADLLNFYEVAYRHGSVFEHSDAWGALAFLDIVEDEVEIQADPSPDNVDFALLGGAFAFAQIVETSGQFWQFEFAGLDEQTRNVVTTAFRRLEEDKTTA